MNESNNVKFAEDNGKWLWKRYNKDGSVIYRSPLFDTEREAREDYDINGGQDGNKEISEDITSTSDQQNTDDRNITDVTTIIPSESENSAGTATIDDEDQNKLLEDNNAGQATN